MVAGHRAGKRTSEAPQGLLGYLAGRPAGYDLHDFGSRKHHFAGFKAASFAHSRLIGAAPSMPAGRAVVLEAGSKGIPVETDKRNRISPILSAGRARLPGPQPPRRSASSWGYRGRSGPRKNTT